MKLKTMKLAVLLPLLAGLLLVGCGRKQSVETTGPATTQSAIPEQEQGTEETEKTEPTERPEGPLMPWEADSAKPPQEYTMAEYEGLTPEQRKAFRNYLGAAGYAEWLEWAKAQEEEDLGNPWETPGAKQPMDYTWKEYQALTEKQKKAFLQALGPNGVEAWLKKHQQKETENPWEKPGAKQPEDYTWSEYQALTSEQQAAFLRHLGTSGYKRWLEKVEVQQGGSGVEQKDPWEKPGAKQPEDYTWEEYETLTSAQQKAFRKYLGADGFEAWLKKIQEAEYPWNQPDAKQPEDYTWEEYEALSESEKIGFQQHLGLDSFDEWLEKIQPEERYPWDEPGSKQPKDYTWAEFEALTAAQQMAFQKHLGEAGFAAWLEQAQKQPEERYPWDEPGSKQPKDYTLAEFEALTGAQQIAFQEHLGAVDFETWLKKVQAETGKAPWEKPGAKQPENYTWEEFEALAGAQQIAFQEYMGDEDFAQWLKKALEESNKAPWEKPGAKQPKDYSWEEFEALTGAQQIAFQTYLGEEAFTQWLEKAMEESERNPWEVPGAKQPQDYTWEEFEALTGAQQIAFQKYLGEEAFESWLNRVLGL